ncbi:tyrosine-type recombinase/integrase [Nonomuraea corallina]|uniref:tyrosine-type recombinase/integrase n=1 Tax=Nonomuraea corallina TaxID=2989783 RepID=UPI0038CD73A1
MIVCEHSEGRPRSVCEDRAGRSRDAFAGRASQTRAEVDKDARVHDARHTAATTLLIEQGVDVSVAQEILEHSQLTTTKRYTHITATLSTEAAARMGRALWG